MKHCLLFMLTLLSVIGLSSCPPQRFNSTGQTGNGRCGIDCSENRCGVYGYDG